jgi:2-keto-4-pentenoate hydratase
MKNKKQNKAEIKNPNTRLKLLTEAHLAKQQLPDLLRINPGLDDATLYEIQQQYVALQLKHGRSVAGYMGGFVPKASAGGVLFTHGYNIEPFKIIIPGNLTGLHPGKPGTIKLISETSNQLTSKSSPRNSTHRHIQGHVIS